MGTKIWGELLPQLHVLSCPLSLQPTALPVQRWTSTLCRPSWLMVYAVQPAPWPWEIWYREGSLPTSHGARCMWCMYVICAMSNQLCTLYTYRQHEASTRALLTDEKTEGRELTTSTQLVCDTFNLTSGFMHLISVPHCLPKPFILF